MYPQPRQVRKTWGSRKARLITIGLALAACSVASPVASAQAAGTPLCPETVLVHPFTSWGDEGYYSLVPGGSFEPGEALWLSGGGARVAFGGEPYDVTGTPDWFSMLLPQNATTQSPYMCVEPNDRTFRFFMSAIGPSASLSVRLVYRTVAGVPLVVASKTLSVGSGWELSPILHTGAAVASTISGGSAELSVGFTALKGIVRIDDVYLDPRMRR
jgi:hypothetical protein